MTLRSIRLIVLSFPTLFILIYIYTIFWTLDSDILCGWRMTKSGWCNAVMINMIWLKKYHSTPCYFLVLHTSCLDATIMVIMYFFLTAPSAAIDLSSNEKMFKMIVSSQCTFIIYTKSKNPPHLTHQMLYLKPLGLVVSWRSLFVFTCRTKQYLLPSSSEILCNN